MADNVVIPATTEASTAEFTLAAWQAATCGTRGLGALEEVDIEVAIGNTWVKRDSMTFGAPAVHLLGPGDFRINKPATAGPVQVGVST